MVLAGSPEHLPKANQHEIDRLTMSVWSKAEAALNEADHIIRYSAPGDEGRIRHAANTMQWYTLVYNAVTTFYECGPRLYEELRKYVNALVKHRVDEFYQTSGSHRESGPLYRFFIREYRCYFDLMGFAQTVFGYLDKFVARRSGLDTVEAQFLQAFHVYLFSPFRSTLHKAIMEDLQKIRIDEVVDTASVMTVASQFSKVAVSTCRTSAQVDRVVECEIAAPYIDDIVDFYTSMARQKISHCERTGDAREFIAWAHGNLSVERDICRVAFRRVRFDTQIRPLLAKALVPSPKRFVSDPHYGLRTLLEDSREHEVRAMFELMGSIPGESGRSAMVKQFGEWVFDSGKALFEDFKGSEKTESLSQVERALCEGIIKLQESALRLIDTAFEGLDEFANVLEEQWVAILRLDLRRTEVREGSDQVYRTNSAEVLASYADSVLRDEYKDLKNASEEEFRLKFLAKLVSKLDDKDIFGEAFQNKMGRRLLQYSSNEELEQMFVVQLTLLCGSSFTQKMEKMIQDLEKASTLSREFGSSRYAGRAELNVKVLTSAHWPPYKTDRMIPHSTLQSVMDRFANYYSTQHSNRKLNWVHMLGSAALKIKFHRGTKEVTCMNPQAMILLLIDERGFMSVRDLQSNIGLDMGKVIKPYLATMYLSKQFPVLRKLDTATGQQVEPRGGISEHDVVVFNDKFVHKTRKFKLPLPSSHRGGSGGSGDAKVSDEVTAQRKCQIDACVVRVLKSSRKLPYPELQMLVIEQLSRIFTPDPRLVKKRVEDLIGRGYCQRSLEDGTVLEYIA